MEELADNAIWIANRYECLEKLGGGSSGTVWLAQDHVRNQSIVLRMIDEAIIAQVGGFEVAAKWLTTTTNFRHPSVTNVFDFAPNHESVYISMQRQKGVVLRQRILEAKKDPSRHITEATILHIIATILDVLEAGALTGWSHAGIKPENIWLDENGTVCLSEYGLHHLLSVDDLKSSAALLRTGHYLAPEMYDHGAKPDFKTDQFALGTLWTELVQCSHLSDHSDSFKRHRAIIQQLTETSPNDRFKDHGALRQAFESIPRTMGAKNTVPSPSSIRRFFQRKKWLHRLVWTPLLLLLIPLWQEYAYESSHVVSNITTRSDLQRMIRALESEQLQLFRDGFQHASLSPHLEALFVHLYPVDAWLELGTSNHETAESPMNRLQSELESELNRVDKGQELVRLYSVSESWTHHIRSTSGIGLEEKEAWMKDLSTIRESALSSLQLGQLEDAIQQLDASIQAFQIHLNDVLSKERNVAAEQRSRWAKLLRDRGTPYAEPQENLSEAFGLLSKNETTPDLVDMILEARRIQSKFTEWSNDWDELPKAPPHATQNSLGMVFVPVGALRVSIWETRVIDFYHFISSTGFDENRSWREESAMSTPSHPVSTITRYGATKFCEWLTEKEHAMGQLPREAHYDLPTDTEWSRLAGLSHEVGDWPEERHFNAPDRLPWEGNPNDFSHHGNYYTVSSANASNQFFGKKDRFHRTAPVGQFKPNMHGLYDVGGNVMEWVSSEYRPLPTPARKKQFTLRGGGWRSLHPDQMRIGHRVNPPAGLLESGFRCVIRNWPERDK